MSGLIFEEENFSEDYEEYLKANTHRDEELLQFIDELLNSEEFTQMASRVIEEEPETVLQEASLECTCTECPPSLAMKAQRLWATERHLERSLQAQSAQKIILAQERSIQVIREKLAEAKRLFLCHKTERALLEARNQEETLKDLGRRYHIELTCDKSRAKAVERVLACRRIRHVRRAERQKRRIAIVRKIVKEYTRQREIDELRSRRYDTKVARREKVLEDVEVIGVRIELLPHPDSKLEEVQVEEEWEDVILELAAEEPPREKPAKGKKGKKGKKDNKKSEGSTKNQKSKKSQKHKKSKKDKKSKKGKKSKKSKKPDGEKPLDLLLPQVPITNQRQKIKPDPDQKMADLIQGFQKPFQLEAQHHKLEEAEEIFAQEEVWFRSNPSVITFQGYENGRVYKRRLNIHNGGSVEKKCRFSRLHQSQFRPMLIEVEPTGGHSVIPGLSFGLTITFTPEGLHDLVSGRLIFLVYQADKESATQLSVPFKCIPRCSNVMVTPETLVFNTMPIWEAQRLSCYQNHKTLTITNSGTKPCRVAISKVEDPFQLGDVIQDHQLSKEPVLDELTESPQLGNISTDTMDAQANLEVTQDAQNHFQPSEAAQETLEDVLDNVFDTFHFQSYHFALSPSQEFKTKVYFRHVDHVGSYNEKYMVTVYESEEDGLECVGSRELMVRAELTGKFIEVVPDTLDFCGCVFGSVYQLSFTVHNLARIPHGVGVKFPWGLKRYLSCAVNDVNVQADGYQRMTIKFLPRRDIIWNKMSYYDPETQILEFPIHVCATSRNYRDTPPTKVQAFALLTDPSGLSLRPLQEIYISYHGDVCKRHQEGCSCGNGSCILDLGECTIGETIVTELELSSNALVSQTYGFPDLPKCIRLSPNYGFGDIPVMGVRRLNLAFSPETSDIPNYELGCEDAGHTLMFPITVKTVKELGSIKTNLKEFKYKWIRDSAATMEDELGRAFPESLVEDMLTCLELLQYELGCEEESKEYLESLPEEPSQQLPDVMSNTLWVKATVIVPLCDLSHQYIELPDTPCGSYSTTSIELRTVSSANSTCVCGYLQKYSKCKRHLQFEVHYQITGDSTQITVEPTCGSFSNGEKIQLGLVARPELPVEVVLETARRIKIDEVLKKKREQWETQQKKKLEAKLTRGKKSVGRKGTEKRPRSKVGERQAADEKGRKGKKGMEGRSTKRSDTKETGDGMEPRPEPEFSVDEGEIVIGHEDLYPAEMVAWRNMEPYMVEARFCCTITYTSNDVVRNPERLYFQATCMVTKPDFVHNLTTQHIQFGPAVIGARLRRTITIQNIQLTSIAPQVSHLSPIGAFSCSVPWNLALPPEHLLKLPITFTPYQEAQEIEYFEIRSGCTVCPLVVSGEGVACNIVFTPDFVVSRLEANAGGFADCTIDVNNQSRAPVALEFVKVCELEGEIKPVEKERPLETIKGDKKGTKNKKGAQGKKSKKDNGSKPKKLVKFSQELDEDELASLEKYFTPKQGESYFEVVGAPNNTLEIDRATRKPIKIRFGAPRPPQKPATKGKRGTGNKEGKSSQSSQKSKASRKSKKREQNLPRKCYLAKYNVILAGTTFLKDFIVIASFK